jgi:SAM-dependent methyltransferase
MSDAGVPPEARVPWSRAYLLRRERVVGEALADGAVTAAFRNGRPLPAGYGVAMDERCVEYPWLLSHLDPRPERLLDAGSALNHEFILEQSVFRGKKLDILTLAPERVAFWQRGISYLYADLRDIPTKNAYYDCIVCLSTLEHVGYDNRMFTGKSDDNENCPEDFMVALREFRRILRPGGMVYLTVPFGVARVHGTFQQFDKHLLGRAVEAFGAKGRTNETFYRYAEAGWQLAQAEDCAECEYVAWVARPREEWPDPLPVEPDHAVAARAVACVQMSKED